VAIRDSGSHEGNGIISEGRNSVAVSLLDALASAVITVGVALPMAMPLAGVLVTWRHSVAVLLSLTGA